MVGVASIGGLDDASEAALLERLEAGFGLRYEAPEEGARRAWAVLPVAKRRGLRHVEAMCVLVLGHCADADEAPPDFLEQLEKATRTFEDLGDTRNQVRAADLLATLLESVGDLPRALHYADITLRGSREIGDRLLEACALSSLAGIFTATGELETATQKAEIGLDLARAVGSRRTETRLGIRLGRILRMSGEHERAQHALENSRRTGAEVGSRFLEVEALIELGRVHEDLRRWDEAEAVLRKSIDLGDVDTRTVLSPMAQVALGRVYLRVGRPEAGRAVLLDLDKGPSVFAMRLIQAEGARLLAEAHDALGESELALAEYRRYAVLREQTMEVEAQRAVKRYQVQVQLAAAERERARYRQLEAVQSQLVESERLAAIGSLAAGLAHEMNTPLGVLRGSLDLTERARLRLTKAFPREGAPAAAFEAMESARRTSSEALERIEGLLLNLRRFIRLDEAQVQAVDLNECVEAALALLSPRLMEGLKIERALAPLPKIRGWPGRLNQALLSLLVNAAEVQAEGGRIRVESRVDGGTCVLRVIDGGPGIPERLRDRLFEIEFDTAGPRASFRVGFATIRSAILDHGGKIHFVTGPEGTTFELRFPFEQSGGSAAPS